MEKGILKIFGILLTFVMVIGIASAAVTSLEVSDSSLNSVGGSFNATVTTDTSTAITLSLIGDIMDSEGKKIIFSNLPSGVLVEGVRIFTINYSVPDEFNMEGENLDAILTANNGVKNVTLTIDESNFCNSVKDGKLEVNIEDITIINGFGDDGEWYPLNSIEVEVNIENSGNDDIDDISLEWGLYDNEGNTWVIEVDEEDNFNLKDDDEENYVLSFTIDSDLDVDLDELNAGTYTLYVRATGTVDNTNEDEVCSYDSETASMNIEKDFVIATEISLNRNTYDERLLEEVSCGSTLTVDGKLFNIGEKDQDDVTLNVYSKELGIDEVLEINTIDSFDSEAFSFNFNVPKDIKEKRYELEFSVYDEDNDLFENGEDDESVTKVYFNVIGSCAGTAPTLNAELFSGESKEGNEVTIKVFLKNEDSKLKSFIVSAEGYDSWANLKDVEPQTLSLGAGESGEVLITLKLDSDSAGEKEFNIVASSNGEVAIRKAVLLTVEEGSFSLDWDFSGWNWQLIGIVALNVILLIAIILVARKVLKKR